MIDRDEAQAKIIALREKAEKEQQSYIQEMKELDRTLEQDRKLKEFMATKISDRSEKGDANRGNETKPLGGLFEFSKKTTTYAILLKAEKDPANLVKTSSTEVLAESLESYEKAFEEIRKVTDITDIGELVEKFQETEDTNFSLFNFVNEINNEIEMEAENIVSIQRKIDGLKVENVEIEQKRGEIMKTLEVIFLKNYARNYFNN